MFRGLIFGILTTVSALADPRTEYEKEIEPLIDIYCYSCHGEGVSKGDFSMDEFGNLDTHLNDLDHWLPVWRNIRSQIMPPSDEDQLEIDEKRKLLAWIEQAVFKLDPENPDPGRVTIRRLNRNEYQYAIRDLLGVEFNSVEYFPADDTGYGFDNIGDVLSISPLLMEKYVAAAEDVVEKALPEGESAQDPVQIINAGEFVEPDDPKETGRWMLFKEDETIESKRWVEWDGEYEVTLEYAIRGASKATDHEALLKVNCNGQSLGEAPMGWDQREVIRLSGKMKLKKGPLVMGITVLQTRAPAEDQEELALVVRRAVVKGPLDGSQRGYSGGYKQIFFGGGPPENDAAREDYAKKILRRFAMRAFRRPPDEALVERLAKIAKSEAAEPGRSFEDGIRAAITACLCSPRFLFRIEIQAEPNNPEMVVPLDEFALASRLSFFLWSSIPDKELLALAGRNELREQLPQQVERMLKDQRSNRFVENFVGQWLQTRDVTTLSVQPHVVMGIRRYHEAVKIFNSRLRENMEKETEMLFKHVLREDRPLEELISASYSFLNERLANFYGIEGVKGEDLVKVDLLNHPERGGILTQGSYLLVTSNPTRTSPVKRGLFVLDNILGTPAPPPPPNTPSLEEVAAEKDGKATMREMMQIHRDSPDCRGCHARMDPIGLGLENFDALGRYRESEHGKPIDASGVLLTGEEFTTVAELKEILAGSRRDDFYRCFSEKLLTYAIGRGVEYFDATTIDSLVQRLRDNDGEMHELILGIIESAPFQKRRGTD